MRIIPRFLILFFVFFGLAACGGSNDDDGSNTAISSGGVDNDEAHPPEEPPALGVDAGPDQYVDASQAVKLAGELTADAASVNAISWIQIAGFEVDLESEDALHTGFTAPRIVQREELIFLLRAESDTGLAEDMVSVVVDPPPLEPPADAANGGGVAGLLADLVGDTTEVLGSLLAVVGAVTQPETLAERREQLANTPAQVRDLVGTLSANLRALLDPRSPDAVVPAVGQTLLDLSLIHI